MLPLLRRLLALVPMLICASNYAGESQLIFSDDFNGALGEGWSWIREHKATWRLRDGALEVRLQPGNMWGPANNARNVLVRAAPDPAKDGMEVSVNFENKPTNQYEQVDLVWYYDDSNMVKIGEELVDGKLSVVMGREEEDQCRTIVIAPLNTNTVQVRFLVKGDEIHGQFRAGGSKEWQEAGKCTLPAATGRNTKISIQCYQGSENTEHWARITQFRVLKHAAK